MSYAPNMLFARRIPLSRRSGCSPVEPSFDVESRWDAPDNQEQMIPNDPSQMRGPRYNSAVKHLHALTGIRYFAALYVAIYHFVPVQSLPPIVQTLCKAGFMGVSLFFILSGFIMYYNYARKADGLSKRSYWIVRFARIYPIYAIAMLISMPGFAKEAFGSIGKIFSPEFVPHFLARFLVVHSWFPQFSERWNTPSWSLACEAFFYFLFPFIIPLAVRWSRVQTLAIYAACCVLALASPLIAEVGQLEHASAAFKFLYYSPLMHLPQFVAGIALARIFVERYVVIEKYALPSFFSAVLVIFALAIVFKEHTIFTQCGVMIVPFSVVILSLASGENLISNFFASNTMQLLGDASYSLYILHSPIHGFMQKVMPVLDAKTGSLSAALFIYLPTITLISVAAYYVVEKPARTAIRKWAKV